MDDLQYLVSPWVILSTDNLLVLNLVINGWPSILKNYPEIDMFIFGEF